MPRALRSIRIFSRDSTSGVVVNYVDLRKSYFGTEFCLFKVRAIHRCLFFFVAVSVGIFLDGCFVGTATVVARMPWSLLLSWLCF